MLLACVDVQYLEPDGARAAVLTFDRWDAPDARLESVVLLPHAEPYQPGAFYKRELPCLLAALASVPALPDVVVVDGHAWLGDARPGLGARLLEAEPRLHTVIGVAKTRFRDAPARPVVRGTSTAPLHVDHCGQPLDAARCIALMHGPHRLPTLLKRVDQLARAFAVPSAPPARSPH